MVKFHLTRDSRDLDFTKNLMISNKLDQKNDSLKDLYL